MENIKGIKSTNYLINLQNVAYLDENSFFSFLENAILFSTASSLVSLTKTTVKNIATHRVIFDLGTSSRLVVDQGMF